MEHFSQIEKALLQDFFLSAFPNPERRECPADDAIQAFAEGGLPPGNPVLRHISSCSECYREFVHYRMDAKDRPA